MYDYIKPRKEQMCDEAAVLQQNGIVWTHNVGVVFMISIYSIDNFIRSNVVKVDPDGVTDDLSPSDHAVSRLTGEP